MRFSGVFGLFALTMMSQSQANPLRSTQRRSQLPRVSPRCFWWLAFVDHLYSQKNFPSMEIQRSARNHCGNDQSCVHAFIMEHW